MYCKSIVLVLLSTSCFSFIQSSYKDRRGKFFGVGLVRFENSICSGREGLLGTCYRRRQCAEVDGTGSGQCASGLGVCCIVQRTCGGSSSENNTYFVSPNFPNPYLGGSTCSLTIQRCNSDICQVRIDFLTLNLAQPNADGVCVNDALYILGGASIVPVICGDNSGQHIYLDFNGDTDIQMVINTNAVASLSRSWNIKVTQIGCDCPTRAPTGCLMYYTELTGTIKSFNYGSTGSVLGTRQLANNNYGVCIRMAAGYCSITYTQSPNDLYSFTVSNDTNAAVGDMTIGTPAASLTDGNCTTDFVVIPHPILANGTASNSDRFCGNGFPQVTTFSKPFVLTVVTDGDDVNDMSNRGFSLSYTQNRCIGSAILG